MPNKKEETVEPVVDNSVDIRYPNGDTAKVAPAAADILCRKADCLTEADYQAKLAEAEKAEKE